MLDEVRQYVQTHQPPELGDPIDVESRRNHPAIKQQLAAIGPAPPGIQEEEISIPITGDDPWTSRAIVTRPDSSTARSNGPLIVLFHGGGFAMGQPESCLGEARTLATLFAAVVVSPSYRLAPEHKFPTGVNDAYAALAWCAAHAAALGADPRTGFIVGGSSAGANFAPVLARRSIDEALRPGLTGQWLAYPVFGHASSSAEADDLLPPARPHAAIWGTSWTHNAGAIVLDGKSAATLFGFLDPDWSSPLFNPLAANNNNNDNDNDNAAFDLSSMPPAFVQVAGLDLTRDDGIVFAYALEDAGVHVRLLVYPGVPHAFPGFFPSWDVSKKAALDLADGFAWLLGTVVVVDA
ncbi:hypothetical protein ACN47E_003056 [Coniothyrium glycines]